MSSEKISEAEPSAPDSRRDPYRGVIILLQAITFAGMIAAVAVGTAFACVALFDVAVTLGISTGVLVGVALAQAGRAHPSTSAGTEPAVEAPEFASEAKYTLATPVVVALAHLRSSVNSLRAVRRIEGGIAAAGAIAVGLVLLVESPAIAPTDQSVLLVGAFCLVGLALAATAASYLAEIDSMRLPEAPALCRGARLVAWTLVVAGSSSVAAWAGQPTIVRAMRFGILAVDLWLCYGLYASTRRSDESPDVFPLDLAVLSTFGSRPNVLASVLDAAERQLGIDLRSTWALAVVRRSIEPLIIGLCVLGWLSTALTVVAVQEEGLVERLGVPAGSEPLGPGLHLHWPWPVDRVFRIPVRQVQMLAVGHEGGNEEPGPEDVLWARQHAENEYTLLLGNGRDLITVDAAVQFRIADAKAWHYHCRNPADALRAIAYRAVMRSTVNRTLADALSENLAAVAARMRTMVRRTPMRSVSESRSSRSPWAACIRR